MLLRKKHGTELGNDRTVYQLDQITDLESEAELTEKSYLQMRLQEL